MIHTKSYYTQLFLTMLPFVFSLLLCWYIVGILIEFLLPGFVSHYINLDLFLWLVILMALLTVVIKKK